MRILILPIDCYISYGKSLPFTVRKSLSLTQALMKYLRQNHDINVELFLRRCQFIRLEKLSLTSLSQILVLIFVVLFIFQCCFIFVFILATNYSDCMFSNCSEKVKHCVLAHTEMNFLSLLNLTYYEYNYDFPYLFKNNKHIC